MIGQKISHYIVLEKIGVGGMGEVFKAQDSRLNRFVAVKVLSAAGTGNREHSRRFVQEAQAASALNHPNIITIYDVFSVDGLEFMVMEFVGGTTLEERIKNGGLTVQKSLDIAVQMADALHAAHNAGIIHRDLKPGNVMVTASGLVKILDFGIAKLTAPSDTGSRPMEPISVEGAIMGTVSYMSPEQAQAKKVDARSDVFSFGVVLYEMLTGRKAFPGASRRSTITALRSIIRDNVTPISQLTKDVPPELEQIVYKALMKEPEDRWHSMEDMRAALMVLKQQSESGWRSMEEMRGALIALKEKADSGPMPAPAIAPVVAAPPAPKKLPWIPIAIAIAALLEVAIAGTAVWTRRAATPSPVVSQSAPVANPPAPVAVAPPPAPEPTPAATDAAMTNRSVLDLVEAKVPQPVIVNQIRSTKTDFDLSTKGVIDLTKGGVPPSLIEVMRNPKVDNAAVRSAPSPATATKSTPVPATPAAATPAPATPPPVEAVPTPVAAAPAVPPPPEPAAAPVVTNLHTVAVPDGLAFNITLAQDVPVKLSAAQKIAFTVTRPVKVGGVIVIAQGTQLSGEVVDAGDKKVLIVKSKATFKLSNVESAGATKLTVRATPLHTDRGDRPIEVQGSKNKDVLAPAGTEYVAFVDGNQAVTIKH